MKQGNSQNTNKKRFWEDRAVIAGAIAVTVFLCLFTAFELLTIKLEWNMPVVSALVGGSDNYIFSQYREDEEALEQSVENVVEATESEGMENVVGVGSTENVEGVDGAGVPESVGSVAGIGDVDRVGSLDSLGMAGEPETVSDTEVEEVFPYYLKINRQQNVVTVYEKDENGEYTVPVKAILCSTGLYNATPKGTFQLSSKYIWRELNGGVYGQYASRITGGVLFHSVPYASKDKSTLSASKYNKLGQQASMGCVRLTVEDAKWIYDNCPSGTYVEVYDSEDPGPLGKPKAIKIDTDSPNKGWDPTDPDEDNPWHAWSEDE